MRSRTDIEMIRLRPGMYVGPSSDGFGIYQLVFEVVANSIVECWPNLCTQIEVKLTQENSIVVLDDGPGIDVELRDANRTHLERLMTQLIPSKDVDRMSILLGFRTLDSLVVTNALSENCEVETLRKKRCYFIRYERGICTEPLVEIDSADRGPGTRVEFVPDTKIFARDSIELDVLGRRLLEFAKLGTGTKVKVTDARGSRISQTIISV